MAGWQPDQYDPRQHGEQPHPPMRAGQPQYPYQQSLPPVFPPPPAAHARKSRIRPGCLLLLVLAAAIGVVIAVTAHGGGGTTWKARVANMAVINPADLAVTVAVTNTGKSAGTPSCTVQANDPSYAYHGVDVASPQGTVQPGRTVFYVDNVTITSQGAQYVTQATVSC